MLFYDMFMPLLLLSCLIISAKKSIVPLDLLQTSVETQCGGFLPIGLCYVFQIYFALMYVKFRDGYCLKQNL